MTSPMIDRMKERIAELEMQNAQLQTLLAAMIGDSVLMEVSFDAVRRMSGRTITSNPDPVTEFVLITIDPIELPDFGGDMSSLLSKEAH